MIVGPFTVERRWDDWHACITGQPGAWGYGPSVETAIGAVVTAHPERFAAVEPARTQGAVSA
jgi:hypothetical protein